MFRRLFTALTLVAAIAPSLAQAAVTRPLTMIVVYAPGGATDKLTRAVATHMSKTLGQQIIIENVTGGGGTTGGARGARAAPDGLTLTVGSLGSHGPATALYKKPGYDPRDLEPIGLIAFSPVYLVVRDDLPVRTFGEFVSYARSQPGRVTSGHSGSGSTSHLACLLLMHLAGVTFSETAYRGAGLAVKDLADGKIDMMCDLAPTLVPPIRLGTIRGLVIAEPARAAVTPDVPTSREVGLPDYTFAGWNAVFAPKGTPKPVADRLSAALNAALADDAVRGSIEELGAVVPAPAERTPDHLRMVVARDIESWRRVIEKSGIVLQ